jgi:hypothetical protein
MVSQLDAQLNIDTQTGTYVTVILKQWFWSSDFEAVILKQWFWSSDFEAE